MDVSENWNLELDADAVLAGQGAHPDSVRRRSPGLVETAERALREAGPLLAPRSVERLVRVERQEDTELILAGGARLRSPALAARLRGAEEVVAPVCTIGAAIEARVSAALADDPVFALALDGVGTAAADRLATAVCERITAGAAARGLRGTPPFSPGMPGWPVAEGQDAIFSLVDGRTIGVELTPSHLMIPRKSVSMVVGLGHRVTHGGRDACDSCGMRATCRYRTRRGAGASGKR